MIKAVALNALVGQTLKSFTAKVTAEALQEVGDLIESGRIAPMIDRAYPLTDAAAAVGWSRRAAQRARSSSWLSRPRRSCHPANPWAPEHPAHILACHQSVPPASALSSRDQVLLTS
jgi:hypothetical protein